jgi:hypothetical protein
MGTWMVSHSGWGIKPKGNQTMMICHSERSEASLFLVAEIRNEATLRSE